MTSVEHQSTLMKKVSLKKTANTQPSGQEIMRLALACRTQGIEGVDGFSPRTQWKENERGIGDT